MFEAGCQSHLAVKVINKAAPEAGPDIFSRAPFELSEALVFSRCRCLPQNWQQAVNCSHDECDHHKFF